MKVLNSTKIGILLAFLFLSFIEYAQPLNNDCSNAIELTMNTNCVPTPGDVNSATWFTPECADEFSLGDGDVWYSYTASSTGAKVSVDGLTDFTPIIEMFEGDCSSLSSLGCYSDPSYGIVASKGYLNLTIGNTYLIRVSGVWSFGDTQFEICVKELAIKPTCGTNSILASDDCASAEKFCNMNGYCGNTKIYDAVNEPNGYTPQTWTELDTELNTYLFSIENNSFSLITPTNSTINLNLWVYNCDNSDGIQFALLDMPSCGSPLVQVVDVRKSLIETGLIDYHELSFDGLTPNQNYYFMVDGSLGAACEYSIGLPPNSGLTEDVVADISSTDICLDESVTLTATGGSGNYTWTSTNDIADLDATNLATATSTPTSIGTKSYSVIDAEVNPLCPINNQASLSLTVHEPVSVDFQADILSGPSPLSVNFTNLSADLSNSSWDFGNGDISIDQDPTALFFNQGSYDVTLNVNDPYCNSTLTKPNYITVVDEVISEDALIYYIPNSFSPNRSDANNDIFTPIFTSGFDPSSYEFKVFDRWGGMVFESTNVNVGWNGEINGKEASPGGYTWIINFKELNSDNPKTITGYVTLLR